MRFDCVPIPQPSAPPPVYRPWVPPAPGRAAGMTPILLPLEVPVRIGRDEAQRRAAEELAKAKYGGTPQWLARPGGAGRAVVSSGWSSCSSGSSATGSGRERRINWGFVVAVVLLLAAVVLVVWRVGLPRWRRRPPGRGGGARLRPGRPRTTGRRPTSMPQRRRLGRPRCGTGSGRWSASWRCRPSSTCGRPERRGRRRTRASRALPACPMRCGRARRASTRWSTATGRPTAAAYQQMVAVDEQVTAAAGAGRPGRRRAGGRPDERARRTAPAASAGWRASSLVLTLVVLAVLVVRRPRQPAAGRRPAVHHAVRRGRARPVLLAAEGVRSRTTARVDDAVAAAGADRPRWWWPTPTG